MLKGIQRRMVEVRTDKSSLFETAYFVLRDETAGKTSERNIVDEAYKIISGTLGSRKRKRMGGAGLFFSRWDFCAV